MTGAGGCYRPGMGTSAARTHPVAMGVASGTSAFAAFDVPVVEKVAVRTLRHRFGGALEREVALPLTFTPFASARPCSARCTFCSETLVHDETRVSSASLRPRPTYARELEGCMRALEGLPIGYSLSGLESTDDAAWLLEVLDVLDAHARRAPEYVEERVLYTNGSGLSPRTTGARLVLRLAGFALTRAEISRHAVDEAANQRIMRFRDGGGERGAFEETVRFVRAAGVPVRLVCVVQREGVSDLDDAERYVAWARTLGVNDVVFRELSRTGPAYRATPSLRRVDAARVPIERFTRALPSHLCAVQRTHGYYYENLRCSLDDVRVTFETSDYADMKARHRSGVVHKLVFHANGNLCADWDPEREVLWRSA